MTATSEFDVLAALGFSLPPETSPQAILDTAPILGPPAGTKASRSQSRHDTQACTAAADDFPDGHDGIGTRGRTAVRDEEEGRLAAIRITEPAPPSLLADPFLALSADILDDLEKVRIANENRLRQLTRTGPDADGMERGFGLDLSQPQVGRVAALVRTMKCDSAVVTELTGEKEAKHKGCCLEHDAERNLVKALAGNPLGPWIAAQTGIGDKQGARLLAAIGDPYIRPEMTRDTGGGQVIEPTRPRRVSELWALCGLHVIRTPVSGHGVPGTHPSHAADGGGDPGHTGTDAHSTYAGVAPRRTRGERANWSGNAKTRAYLVAESCIKQAKSPYRPVYDDGRARYADALHDTECARCGPKGKPAQPGSPLSDGHKHARAMRLVMKEILRDLWTEARRIHEGPESSPP